MVANIEVPIGTGAYSVNEIAWLARMHPATARRWFFGTNMGRPIVSGRSKERYLGFLDYIQALAVRNLRVNHAIPLSNIREAISYAKDEFGMDHPFARQHETYLDGRSIVIQPAGTINPVVASGKSKGQQLIKKIAESYLSFIEFEQDSGIAKRYLAYQLKDRRIWIDPEINFGQPYLETVGISAARLADAVLEEGDFESAAQAFGVQIDDVTAAYRFVDELKVA